MSRYRDSLHDYSQQTPSQDPWKPSDRISVELILKQRRIKQRLNQLKLSEITGIGRRILDRIEMNAVAAREALTSEQLEKYAAALELSVSDPVFGPLD
jgi:transcriptional regulator with XRE-family HTH domain